MNTNNIGVALITGASSGIGLATAKALKQAGYRVFGTSRRAVASADGITMLICDVTDDASVQKMVAEVLKQAGRIDLLVNTVLIAATATTPRRRYTAGKLAYQVSFMRRFLPESMVDKNLRKFNNLPV